MPNLPTVSLILIAGPGQNEAQIHQARQSIAACGWQTQTILVQPQPEHESVGPQNVASKFQKTATLVEALHASEHPVIAIVEPRVALTTNDWQFLANRIDNSPVQVAIADDPSRRPSKRLGRMLLRLYCLLVRCLLGTGKTEHHAAVTILKKAEVDLFLGDYSQSSHLGQPDSDPISSPAFEVTQLLATIKLHRRGIAESNCLSVSSSAEPGPPSKPPRISAFSRVLKFWWNGIMFPRQHNELPQKRFKRIERFAAFAILLVVASFVLFRCLSFPLFEPDEARNAQLAMNIVSSGQWMSLSLAEDYYWDKPPFQMWAIAASYHWFGVSQFSTRFPVALASLFTLLTTLCVGQRLVGFRSAWLAAFLLLLSAGFVCTSRYVTMDATLTASTTAMFLFGYLAIGRRFKKSYAIAAGIACGVGMLVKGPVIGVLCLPPLLAAGWLSTSSQPRPRRWWLWFAVPAALIAAPWYIATAVIHPDYLVYFFWKHHVVRYSDAFNHREPFWYFFVGVFIFMFPASYLIPSAVKFMTSRKPENRLLRTREQAYLFLSAVWIIGFFSLSQSKLPTYIVPAFPPICLLMGALLDRKLFTRHSIDVAPTLAPTQKTRRSWLENIGRRAPLELLFWFGAIATATFAIGRQENFTITMAEMAGVSVALVALACLTLIYRHRPKIAWACFGVIGISFVAFTAHHVIPTVSKSRSIHQAARQLQQTDEFEDAPYVFFGRETYGSSLTLNPDEITWFDETETMAMMEFLTANPTAIIISSEDQMDSVRRDLTWAIEIEECEDARHLYVSRPNPTVVARRQSESLFR